MLDDMDRRLLRYWQAEPSLSPGELAERCGMTPGKAARRIAKMEDDGIVQGVSAVVNWAALGYAVEVSLRVTLDKTQSNAFDASSRRGTAGARGDRGPDLFGPRRCAPLDHRP